MSSMITSAVPEVSWAQRPDGRLVGRARERRLLDGLVESAEGGGTAVIIAGEAGVGKTALLTHVAGVASERGLRVLKGRGEESEAVLAFATLADLLRPSREKLAELPRARLKKPGIPPGPDAGPAAAQRTSPAKDAAGPRGWQTPGQLRIPPRAPSGHAGPAPRPRRRHALIAPSCRSRPHP